MSIHGVLGESTSYPQSYAPDVLFAIPRSVGRDEIYTDTGVAAARLSQGVDVWQAFELSWLAPNGVSKVAVARLSIPANSPNIAESKSLKLYFNSLNFTTFSDVSALTDTIIRDVSACVGVEITLEVAALNQADGFSVAQPVGVCIDDALDGHGGELPLSCDISAASLAASVQASTQTDEVQHYQLYSQLLRSNCPVTNQPDWGTLSIDISTATPIDKAALLQYILSFRKHNGFHEQCVERIFADLLTHYQPTALSVQANYTRRGGIDINPVRVFNMSLPKVGRMVRQ